MSFLDLVDPERAAAAPPASKPPVAPTSRAPTIQDLLPSKQDTAGLADIMRQESKEASIARQETLNYSKHFLEQQERQYNAQGVDSSKFQKWDAQHEWQERQTDPLVAFGSLGSVFGMIASAFTHAPMENALNASAAAMNAIHAGDRDSYERAHEAWKQNIDLAMKRQQMEREHYLDAFKLFDTNVSLGNAKVAEVAARYQDKKMIYLADRGMIPEMFQLVNDRMRTVSQATDLQGKLTREGFQNEALEKRFEGIDQQYPPDKNPTENMGAKQFAMQMYANLNSQDLPHQLYGQKQAEFWQKNKRPMDFAESQKALEEVSRAQYAGRSTAGTKLSPEQIDIYTGLVKENSEKGMSLVEAQEDALRRLPPLPHAATGAGGVPVTEDRQRKVNVDEIMKEKETSGELKGKSKQEIADIRADVSRELQERGKPLPPNRADDLRRSIGQLDRASRKIDDIEKMMKQHGMITGLGGQIRRPGETIVDILGGDATAAKEFQAQLTELQQWVSQLIDNKVTSGRPLSLAETRVNTIVPGLKLGDTVQFVTKQLRSVQKDLQDMQRENTSRLNKSPDMPGAPAGAPAAKPSQEPAWKRLGIPVQ